MCFTRRGTEREDRAAFRIDDDVIVGRYSERRPVVAQLRTPEESAGRGIKAVELLRAETTARVKSPPINRGSGHRTAAGHLDREPLFVGSDCRGIEGGR